MKKNKGINLLKETLSVLKSNNKSEQDVLWVGTTDVKTTWEEFKKIANTYYDDGFGSQKVAYDLIIVGNNWWLERTEYDGSESWSYKEIPITPIKNVKLRALTVEQGQLFNEDLSCGWLNLEDINNGWDWCCREKKLERILDETKNS